MSHPIRYAILLVGIAAAIAPGVAAQSSAQTNPKKAPPAKTQKLANPLNELLDEAQRDIDRNDFQDALAPLQKFLAEKPDVAYAHFQLGYAYTALQRWEEARSEYQRAIELDPKLAEAHLNLGTLLLDHDPAAAVTSLRKAVELLPAQSRPRYLLGRALERYGDMKGALDAFEGAERLDPRDLDTVLAHAQALNQAKRFADAEGKFRAALGIDANSVTARLGLARSLDAQHKPEAADAYRSYFELRPGDSPDRLQLARMAFREKQYDEALAELDRADGGKDPSADSLRLRADIQVAQAHWEEAIATLRSGIAAAPGDVQLQAGLGRIYLQKRDFPAAEKELKAALQIKPGYLPALKDLSSTYTLAGNCAATLGVLDEIARQEVPNAGAWFVRAICCDKLGQAQAAVDAYQKFLDLDRNEHDNQDWQAKQRISVLRKTLEKKH